MIKKKHICIIGLGEFGSELARVLSGQLEVLALDRNAGLVNSISDDVQRAMVVDVRDFPSLSSVVTKDFDEAVVSIGDSLESSILATLHLKRIGVPVIHAKAKTVDHASILRSVGATDIIFPERETAHRVAAQIINPNLLDFIPLAEDYRVMDLAPPNAFYGKSLQDLNLRRDFSVFIIAIKELVPMRFVFMPDPSFVIKPSDILVAIGKEEAILRIQELYTTQD